MAEYAQRGLGSMSDALRLATGKRRWATLSNGWRNGAGRRAAGSAGCCYSPHTGPRAGVRPRCCAGRCLDRARRGRGCSAPALLRGHDPRPADPRSGSPPWAAPDPGCPVGRSFGADPPGDGGCPVGGGTVPPLPAAQPAGRLPELRGAPEAGPARARAIAALSPGDPLQVRAGENRWELLDRSALICEAWEVVVPELVFEPDP